jgi:hypothetical protein
LRGQIQRGAWEISPHNQFEEFIDPQWLTATNKDTRGADIQRLSNHPTTTGSDQDRAFDLSPVMTSSFDS